MSGAKGAATGGNLGGNTQHRGHNDGSSSRAYSSEQKAAVLRVKRCGVTAYYDILGLENARATVDDAGIKKAYRKLSLLTHPDKNGLEGADEAFKMVSKAFQCLSDPEKRKRYDQFGGDPDSRFSPAQPASPFSGFTTRGTDQNGNRGQVFEEDISPEELFRQFFGGGLGGGLGSPFGGGMFDNGPGFLFNLGVDRGVRVHRFGGTMPRRRPQNAEHMTTSNPTSSEALRSMLPLLLLLIIPLFSTIFSGSNQPAVPAFNLDVATPQLEHAHTSARLQVAYFVDPSDVSNFDSRDWRRLDDKVENTLLNRLQRGCETEQKRSSTMYQEAQGWFSIDAIKLAAAQSLPAPSCERLSRYTGVRYI